MCEAVVNRLFYSDHISLYFYYKVIKSVSTQAWLKQIISVTLCLLNG